MPMSLTLLYRGKNVRFSMRLTKLHWLSAVCAFALVSGIILHLIVSNKLQPSGEQYQVLSPVDSVPVLIKEQKNYRINNQISRAAKSGVTFKCAWRTFG